jgi:hypothetical protein
MQKGGFSKTMPSADGDGVKERRFPIIEIIVVAVLVSLVLGLFVPAVFDGGSRSSGLQCGMNLIRLHAAALMYAETKGSGYFPFGRGPAPRAHESLNELIRSGPENFDPGLFICPKGEAVPATRESDGSLRLDQDSLSYAWLATPTKRTTTNVPLACDKFIEGYRDTRGVHHGHWDGVQAIYTDGYVVFLVTRDLSGETALPPGLTR